MKKVLFIVFAAFLMVGTATAQLPISKGNFFANANISGLDLSFSDDRTSFDLGVNGGYFLADKLALIGGVDVSAWSHKIGGEKTKYNSFGINAGVRYYFVEQTNGSFFVNGLFGIDKAKGSDATAGLTLGGGYAFFLNQHVALEPMVSLWLPFSSDYDVTFSIGGGISVYF